MFTDDEKQDILRVKSKIEDYLRQLGDEPWVKNDDLPWDRVYLSGGVTVSVMHDEEPKDFDFYFHDMDAMYKITDHLKKNHNFIADVDPKYNQHLGTDGKMITTQAITMKNKWSFITMICGRPEHIRNSFDYVHCKPYYSIQSRMFFISEEQYHACKEKKLVVNNAKMVKTWRTDKFIKRGFKNETRLYS